MQIIRKKFSQKTVINVSRATLLGVAVLLFVNLIPQTASAETVFSSGGDSGTLEVNLQCGDGTCRASQQYVSRGENIPTGTVFDKIQVRTTSTTTAPRFNIYLFQDTGDARTSCETASCVNDDTYITDFGTGATGWSHVGDGVWQKSVIETTVSTAQTYLYVGLDPNSPYQRFTFLMSVDGTTNDGYNTNRTENAYQYQICSDTCDGFGTYIPGITGILADSISNYDTRFTSGVVSGTSTSIQFDINYFLDNTEYTGSNEPNLVRLGIVKEGTFSDTQMEPIQKRILAYASGADSVTLLANEEYTDGDYYAFGLFANQSSGEVVFPEAKIELSFTVSGGIVTSSNVRNIYSGENLFSTSLKQDCSVTNISGCINNSMLFLFYPSADSLDTITSQYTTLQTKAPFIYVYQASDLLTGMYNGTAGTIPAITVETGIGDITLISEAQVSAIPFVPLLRSLIGAGLWLMLFTALYRKTLAIHDKQTV